MEDKDHTTCPICNKSFLVNDIQQHANRCIFLNCPDEKRKRSPSPEQQNSQAKLVFNQKSPRDMARETPPSEPSKQSNEPQMNGSLSFLVPLAKQVQPKTLGEFFGQSKVLGKNTVLHNLLQQGEIPNMILWGPPGCGKTSLAGIINHICKENPKKLRFASLCAASCGVKDVQSVITVSKNEMKYGRKTVLFMDEIHAFNKKQQDTMLLSVEKGEITLVGATTENPSFSINSALLSRCRVIVMEKLGQDTLMKILENAAKSFDVSIIHEGAEAKCGAGTKVSIESAALQFLADFCDGDARIALNNLQLVIQHNNSSGKLISIEDIKEGVKKCHMLYDRQGEEHYNLVSAMHKSIRGSDANAALYWTARMLAGGEDPRFIARRLVRAASEDVGNADPAALPLAVATMQGCQLLGMPEADVLLAQCAIYLARAPKSREADEALGRAKTVVGTWKGRQPAVPMHLRNAPTGLMKKLGYGKPEEGQEGTFMPPELEDTDFFD
ncbi:unnamed protein product [Phaedon cochleariae]|uniref:AAA+ ATPase domain-containing protein n=1 Tax=Phaedon cochleariae TaxID=80249 RepID=A0A9P0GT78_PHACE|nr:unnamed protein product [Phaedon cochleariae]